MSLLADMILRLIAGRGGLSGPVPSPDLAPCPGDVMRIHARVPGAFVVAATGLTAVAVVGPRLGTGGAAAVAATQASSAAATVPYAPYPVTGTEVYVDNASASNCSDSGAGSQSQPLCTIAAAASAVQPGQTVIVEPGVYPSVTLSVAGTPDAPITFTAIKGATVNASASGPLVTLSGAHNVVLNGFIPSGPQQGFYVTGGSSGTTINGGSALGGSVPSIEVDGTSSGVTVSRMAINSRKPIQVDSGASGVVITGNTLRSSAVGDWGVLATDAHGIDVTGNTIHGLCSGGISIAGASSGVTVENNIVQSESSTCPTGTAVSVSAGSEAGTVVGYNLIDRWPAGPCTAGAARATPAWQASRRPPARARTTSWRTRGWGKRCPVAGRCRASSGTR
jgi:Right handed beta helix region